MASNTRGKLKEELEGVHRNFDWVLVHVQKALVLIQDHKPELSKSLEALGRHVTTIDELAQGIYSKI